MKTVAKILLKDLNNKILVLTRSDTHPHYPLHLDFPGGLVNPGEPPDQAVIRELLEETGLTISQEVISKIMEIPNGNAIHLLYEGTINSKSPNIHLSWEHNSYEWIDRDKLLQIEHPEGVDSYYIDAIRHIQSHKK